MSDDWKESLPEPLREAPYFKAAESLDQALQGIQDAAAWQGNSLRIPGPDAGEEAHQEFLNRAVEKIPGLMPVPSPENVGEQVFAKIGKPEEAAAYKVREIENFELTPEQSGELKAFAFENNYTQSQFDSLVDRQAKLTLAAQSAAEKSLREEQTLIDTEWGEAKDGRLEQITNFLANDKSAPEELLQAVREGKITSSYAKWLHGLVERVSEPGELQGQPADVTALPPSEAREQFEELTARLIKMHPGDPGYQDLADKRVDLAKMAFAS